MFEILHLSPLIVFFKDFELPFKELFWLGIHPSILLLHHINRGRVLEIIDLEVDAEERMWA